MGVVEPCHVAEGGHAHAPWFGEARPEIERAAQQDAGEDVAEQIQHSASLSVRTEASSRMDEGAGISDVRTLFVLVSAPYQRGLFRKRGRQSPRRADPPSPTRRRLQTPSAVLAPDRRGSACAKLGAGRLAPDIEEEAMTCYTSLSSRGLRPDVQLIAVARAQEAVPSTCSTGVRPSSDSGAQSGLFSRSTARRCTHPLQISKSSRTRCAIRLGMPEPHRRIRRRGLRSRWRGNGSSAATYSGCGISGSLWLRQQLPIFIPRGWRLYAVRSAEGWRSSCWPCFDTQ
jgi:hypothetical protein